MGGPPKFWLSFFCSMGPQQLMLYCIFKKEFSEILGLCYSMRPSFSKKSAKNTIHFRKFLQKINALTFIMVSNGEILKNFDEVTHKTSHCPFLENFEKYFFFENLTPKLHSLLHFYERNFGRVCCSMGQKTDFVLLGSPIRVGPPRTSLIRM